MAVDAGPLQRVSLALAIGALAGWLANRVGLPLPWMLGPMIGNTLASVVRLPVGAPLKLRPLMVPVIGVLLGSALTPDLLAQAGQWVATLALMPIYLALAGGASMLFYRRVAGYDPVTSYFAAMPGGLNDMVLLGGEAGGDERRIALAHSSRIMIVVLFTGLFFWLFLDVTAARGGRAFVPISDFSVIDASVLIGAGVLGYFVGRALRLPAAPMLGPMILSGIVHLTGLVALPPPSLFVIAAQVVLGTIIGCRFSGVPLRDIGLNLAYGAGATLLMLALAVGFAAIVAAMGQISMAGVFLAYSPGGLTEMSLLAIATGLEPAFVTLSHLSRILMVIAAAPIVFARSGVRK